MSVQSALTAIADKIRVYTSVPGVAEGQNHKKYSLEEMPAGIDAVVKRQTAEGYNTGYFEGVEIGQRDGMKNFWKHYQEEGRLSSYSQVFYGKQWTDDTYDPRYRISPTSKGNGLNNTFRNSCITDTKVIIDTNEINDLAYTFAYASKLKRIDMINLGKLYTKFSNTFVECSALEEITFVGFEISSDINFQWSPLNLKTARDIIIKLMPGSSLGCTICFSAYTWSLLDADSQYVKDKYGFDSWRDYIEFRTYWITA